MKKLRSFKIKRAKTMKKPVCLLKVLAGGDVELRFNKRHKKGKLNFEFKPLTLSKQEAVSQALELRPDLKSNEMLVLVQNESLKAIKKQYLPEITGDLTWGYTKSESTYSSPLQLGASVGLGSINPYGIHYQVKEGESYDGFDWWPADNGGGIVIGVGLGNEDSRYYMNERKTRMYWGLDDYMNNKDGYSVKKIN